MARKLQAPMQHWSHEYKKVTSEDGRIAYIPRNEATGGGTVDFVANLATAALLVFWTTQSGLAFFNLWPVGIAIFFGLIFWQHESVIRWPLRCVVWAIFWGMYYFGLHWVPLF